MKLYLSFVLLFFCPFYLISHPLHILHPLHQAIGPITDSIQQRLDRTEILFNPETIIPPFELLSQQQLAQQAPRRTHRRQTLIQQMTIRPLTDIQPQGIVIIRPWLRVNIRPIFSASYITVR